jgi:hypothetical protein
LPHGKIISIFLKYLTASVAHHRFFEKTISQRSLAYAQVLPRRAGMAAGQGSGQAVAEAAFTAAAAQ